jgi:hypothetical protein
MACPLKCALCSRLCAEPDHFHGMSDVVHLCGYMSTSICDIHANLSYSYRDEHACNMMCAQPGMCDVQPNPRSVQVLFSGRHETFQYTQVGDSFLIPLAMNILKISKHNQIARRLPCMTRIPPGQLRHPGVHNHGNDHHTCEAMCLSCEYYCDLPLGNEIRIFKNYRAD